MLTQQSQPTAREQAVHQTANAIQHHHPPAAAAERPYLHHAAGHKGQRAKRQCAFNGDHGEHPAHARGMASNWRVLARVSGNEKGAGFIALPTPGVDAFTCRHSSGGRGKQERQHPNATRQPSASTAKPPNHWPAIIPDTVATISPAKVSWRCS